MAFNFGRFASPSLGVVVTASIDQFQKSIGQIPTITKSALSQAAQHIQAFNNMITSSMSSVGARIRDSMASVGRAVQQIMNTTKGYFSRTRADDLGIPELAGRLDPSKFMLHTEALGNLARVTASKVMGAFSGAFSSISSFMTSSFSKGFDSVADMASNVWSKMKGTWSKYFGRSFLEDNLGIQELARLQPSRFDNLVSSIKTKTQAALSQIGSFVSATTKSISTSVASGLSNAWSSAITPVLNIAKSAGASIKQNLITPIGDYFTKRTPVHADDLGIPEFARLNPTKFMQQWGPAISTVQTAYTKALTGITNLASTAGTKIKGFMANAFALPTGAAGQPQPFFTGLVQAAQRLPGRMLAAIGGGMNNFTNGINNLAGGFNRAFGPTQFTTAISNINGFFNGILGHIFNIRNALAALGGVFIVKWGKDLAGSFIEAASEMQSFRLQIEAIYKGSLPMVDAVMDRLVKFARETPFSTQETVRAFNIMESAGFEATKETLDALGKLAFTFHRTMEDVARDFVSQRTQSLHTFGIDIQHMKDKTIVMMGDTVKVVRNSRSEVVKALTDVINTTLPGLTEKALGTWKGVMEFFDSIWFEIRAKIGQSILQDLQPKLLSFGKVIENMMTSGKFDAAADSIGSAIGRIGEAVLKQGTVLVNWLANLNPDKIDDFFDRIVSSASVVFEKVKGYLTPVVSFIGDMISTFDSLPPSVKEVGLISAIIFGPGTPLALLAGLTALGDFSIGGFLSGLKKGVTTGNWGFTGAGGPSPAAATGGTAAAEAARAEKLPRVTARTIFTGAEGKEGVPYVEEPNYSYLKEADSSVKELGDTVKTLDEPFKGTVDATKELQKTTKELSDEQSTFSGVVRTITTALGAYLGFGIGGVKGAVAGGFLGNQFGPQMGGPALAGAAGYGIGSMLGGPLLAAPLGVAGYGLAGGKLPAIGKTQKEMPTDLGGQITDFLVEKWNSFFQSTEEDILKSKIEQVNMAISQKNKGRSLFGIQASSETQAKIDESIAKLEDERATFSKALDELNLKSVTTATQKMSATSQQISDMIEKTAKKYDIDPNLMKAIASVESSFTQFDEKTGEALKSRVATASGERAIGMMQIMPANAQKMKLDVTDLGQNLDAAGQLIADLNKRFKEDVLKGDLSRVVAGYNTTVERATSGNLLPETKKYVPQVLAEYQRFKGGAPVVAGKGAPGAEKTSIRGLQIEKGYAEAAAGIDRQEKDAAKEKGIRDAEERLANRARLDLRLLVNKQLEQSIKTIEKSILKETEQLGTIGLYGAALEKQRTELEKNNNVEQIMLTLDLATNDVIVDKIEHLSVENREMLKRAGVINQVVGAIGDESKAMTAQEYIVATLTPFYEKLAIARQKAFSAEKLFKVIETQKDMLQDLENQIRAEMAVTSEEKAQAEAERILSALRKEGYNFISSEIELRQQLVAEGKNELQVQEEINAEKQRGEDHLRAQLEQYQTIKNEVQAVLKVHQEYADSIKGGITAIGDTLAGSLGKITDTLFTKGKKDWRGLFQGIIGDIKKSVDDMLAASVKALFQVGVKQVTGKFPEEIIGGIGNKASDTVFGSPQAQIDKLGAARAELENTLRELQKGNLETAASMSASVKALDTAASAFTLAFGKADPVIKALTDALGYNLTPAAVNAANALNKLAGLPAGPVSAPTGPVSEPTPTIGPHTEGPLEEVPTEAPAIVPESVQAAVAGNSFAEVRPPMGGLVADPNQWMMDLMKPLLTGGIAQATGGAGAGGGFKAVLSSALPTIMNTMSTSITKSWVDGTKKGTTESKVAVGDLAKDTESIFSKTIDGIGSMFDGMVNGVSDAIKYIWSYIKPLIDATGKWIESLFTTATPTGDTGEGSIISGLGSSISKMFTSSTTEAATAAVPEFNPKGIYLSDGGAVSGAELNEQATKTAGKAVGSALGKAGATAAPTSTLAQQICACMGHGGGTPRMSLPDMETPDYSNIAMDIIKKGDYTVSEPPSGDVFKNFPSPFGNQPNFPESGFDFSSSLDNLDSQMSDVMGNNVDFFFSDMTDQMSNLSGPMTDSLTSSLPSFFSDFSSGFDSLFSEGGGIFDSISSMFSGEGGIMDSIMGMFSGGGGGGGIMDSIMSMFSGAGGGMMSMFSGAGSAISSGVSEGASMAMSIIPSLFSFLEEGGTSSKLGGMSGIVTQPMSVLHYAKGGIASMPGGQGSTLTQIGENAPSQFEAVVPLPDNKSIPVQLRGGGGMGEMDSKHDINLAVHLVTPVVDPQAFQPTPQQIVQHVKADYMGDGELRTTIREDMGRGG